MIRLVNRDRPRLGGAGADPVGALAAFAPFCAHDQSRLPEHFLERGIDFFAQNHTVRVGEQQHIAGAGDLFIERIHLGARNLHQIVKLGVQFLETALIDHPGLVVAFGIEFEIM